MSSSKRSKKPRTWTDPDDAAGPLVAAALDETQSLSMRLSQQVADDIKQGLSFSQSTANHASNIVEKLDRLQETADATKTLLPDLKQVATTQAIQWGIKNVGLLEFGDFSDYKQLVNNVLLAFMGDIGYTLDDQRNGCTVADWSGMGFRSRQEERASREAALQNALSNDVRKLTGLKPRFVKEKRGNKELWIAYRS